MMKPVADLELSLRRQEQNAYAVDFRYADTEASSQAEVHLGAQRQALVSFDFDQLNDFLLTGEMKEYGQILTAAFFRDEDLRTAFAQARATAMPWNCTRCAGKPSATRRPTSGSPPTRTSFSPATCSARTGTRCACARAANCGHG